MRESNRRFLTVLTRALGGRSCAFSAGTGQNATCWSTLARSWAALAIAVLFQLRAIGAENLPAWDWSASLRSGGGYKDNILLSEIAKEASWFSFTEADLFVFRLPVDSWEFLGFVTAEDRRFWQSTSADKEQLLLSSLDFKRRLWQRWKAGLTLQYLYNDQVLDASVLGLAPIRIPAVLHQFNVLPSMMVELPKKRRIEFIANVRRENFEFPLDDLWEVGPKLLFGQKYGVSSEFTLSVQFLERSYDQKLSPGSSIGETLRVNVTEYEAALRHYWDKEKHWKSRARLGVEFDTDSGAGFYNYSKYRVSKELAFASGGFEIMVNGKLLYYDYTSQTVGPGQGRRRTELLFGGRVKQKIFKKVSLFVEAEHEWVMASDELERYRATTIWGGLDWEIR